MVDVTGFHMLFSNTKEAVAYAPHLNPSILLGWLAVKLVMGFLWVWLCVYLLNRWNLVPFKKAGKKR